jgi:hypothetical protein
MVARANEPRGFEDLESSWPTVFYASPSMSWLLSYQPGELEGRSTADLYEGTFEVMVEIISGLLRVSRTPVGPSFDIKATRYLAKGSGPWVNLRTRHQILYSPSGKVRRM